MKCGYKYISTYRNSENKILNASYLLPENMKEFKYIDIYDMHSIWTEISYKFLFKDKQKKKKKKKIRIICDINCGSKYISTYRYSEREVLNVSYLPPDNIKD